MCQEMGKCQKGLGKMNMLPKKKNTTKEMTYFFQTKDTLSKKNKEKKHTNRSNLPCMHLDPRVNRLRFSIASIHQIDCGPVAPDIVFPICVILQQREKGSYQQKTKKEKKTV